MTLLETQRCIAAAVMRPLGVPVDRDAESILKPNDRLTAIERLEIYRRSYWCRLIDSMTEDFPGLRLVLGKRAFRRMVEAYLEACPSRSFTLRDLGGRLEQWLRQNPEFAGSNPELALDMARLEWADIAAFDGAEDRVLGPEDLNELDPNMGIGLQPYIGLLELKYPVDEIRIGARKPRRLQAERIFLAVHRLEMTVYFRRLRLEEFRLLWELRAGSSVGAAIQKAFEGGETPAEEIPPLLSQWFATWSRFGWLCLRPKREKRLKYSS